MSFLHTGVDAMTRQANECVSLLKWTEYSYHRERWFPCSFLLPSFYCWDATCPILPRTVQITPAIPAQLSTAPLLLLYVEDAL